jgi:hypothetical protein
LSFGTSGSNATLAAAYDSLVLNSASGSYQVAVNNGNGGTGGFVVYDGGTTNYIQLVPGSSGTSVYTNSGTQVVFNQNVVTLNEFVAGSSVFAKTSASVAGGITPGYSGSVGTATVYSGSGVPSFSANTGSIYLSSNANAYLYNGSTWSTLGIVVSTVYSFSAGTTGFSPNTSTSGNITLSGVLNVANGGTGSSTQNFVDLTTTQTIGGAKTFSSTVTAPGFSGSGASLTSIPNTALVNSSVTLNGTSVSLGATENIVVNTISGNAYVALVSSSQYPVNYVIIGGGGGGGYNVGGGGGGGGVLIGTLAMTSGTTYSFSVGGPGAGAPQGGGGAGGTGGNSTLSGGSTTLTANGGGGGGSNGSINATVGGSGGGGTYNGSTSQGASGTAGQGFPGGPGVSSYAGGGGGGAAYGGGPGYPNGYGGSGGSGIANNILGTWYNFGAGGGGGNNGTGSYIGSGGQGGGGQGGYNNVVGSAGSSYGAGGGGGGGNASGGSGEQGAVIISIPTSNYTGTVTGSPSVATVGNYKVLTFTGSGSYTA